MDNKSFKKYYYITLASALVLLSYPIYMGVKLAVYMARNGVVPEEGYPKYAIPYVPIAVAVLLGIIVIPLFFRLFKRRAFAVSAVFSGVVFLGAELIMETKVLIEQTSLESWQMYMCYQPPEGWTTRTWKSVNILAGEYSPAFKLHFYLISVLLVVAVLNSVYGFGNMIRTGDKSRKKALTVQSVAAVLFLGMCIWACFTAFYRGGEIEVSTLSAVLMSVFFVLMGFTAGIFTASFLIGKKRPVSVFIPAAVASLVTLAMYVGEMILLSGNLYRFGTGSFFEGIPGISLAPVDILIILLSGAVTWITARALNKPRETLDE